MPPYFANVNAAGATASPSPGMTAELFRRVRGEERQDGLVELACPYLGQRVPAARKDLDLRPWDQAGQFLGEISRRDDVVLGADNKGRRLDPAELLGAIEGEDRVDPAGGDLGRRKDRKMLGFELAQPLIVPRHKPARIEIHRIRLDIGAGAEPQQDVLAEIEQPPEIRVGLGPARREHHAGKALRVLDRENLRNGAARRMTDDMGALYLQRIHQPDDVGSHAVDREAAERRIALPDPAVIVRYDVEFSRESRDLLVPKGGKTAQPGDEQHGESHPLPLVIKRALAGNDSRHRPANPTRMGVGITAIGGCQTATLQATPAALCRPQPPPRLPQIRHTTSVEFGASSG